MSPFLKTAMLVFLGLWCDPIHHRAWATNPNGPVSDCRLAFAPKNSAPVEPRRSTFRVQITRHNVEVGIRTAEKHVDPELLKRIQSNRTVEQRKKDREKVFNHAVAAALTGKSYEEQIAIAETVFFLHVLDDMVDNTEMFDFGPQRQTFGFLLSAGFTNTLAYFILGNFAREHPSDFEKLDLDPVLFNHIVDIIDLFKESFLGVVEVLPIDGRQRDFAKGKDPAAIINRYIGATIIRSLFHILAGALDHIVYEDPLVYAAAMEEFKFGVLGLDMSELSGGSQISPSPLSNASSVAQRQNISKELASEFIEVPPTLFSLISKTTMHAILGVEAQPYLQDRALIWTIIYSPFLYDFNKDRHAYQSFPLEELVKVLEIAFRYMHKVHDDRLPLRLYQLRYVLENWPHSFPDEILNLYEAVLERAAKDGQILTDD